MTSVDPITPLLMPGWDALAATPLARRITGGTVYVDGGANIVA
jgi:hypothetical protein